MICPSLRVLMEKSTGTRFCRLSKRKQANTRGFDKLVGKFRELADMQEEESSINVEKKRRN